ncbi:hypothetical protein MT962_000034 [Franconibacter sp. IITDAS19]|nr:hypothetical protein [Franconibacter sp. IITDAS19]
MQSGITRIFIGIPTINPACPIHSPRKNIALRTARLGWWVAALQLCGGSHAEGTTQSAVEWRHHHSRPGEPAGRPGGDVQSALAGGAAPYLADVIGHKLNLDEGSKAIAHAIAGAVVAELQGRNALAGAAGAVAGKNAVENNSMAGDKDRESLKESAERWKEQIRDNIWCFYTRQDFAGRKIN